MTKSIISPIALFLLTFGVIFSSLNLIDNFVLAQVADNSSLPETHQTRTTTSANQTGNQTNENPLKALESVEGLFSGK